MIYDTEKLSKFLRYWADIKVGENTLYPSVDWTNTSRSSINENCTFRKIHSESSYARNCCRFTKNFQACILSIPPELKFILVSDFNKIKDEIRS